MTCKSCTYELLGDVTPTRPAENDLHDPKKDCSTTFDSYRTFRAGFMEVTRTWAASEILAPTIARHREIAQTKVYRGNALTLGAH